VQVLANARRTRIRKSAELLSGRVRTAPHTVVFKRSRYGRKTDGGWDGLGDGSMAARTRSATENQLGMHSLVIPHRLVSGPVEGKVIVIPEPEPHVRPSRPCPGTMGTD
jgi:hypothetical protein